MATSDPTVSPGGYFNKSLETNYSVTQVSSYPEPTFDPSEFKSALDHIYRKLDLRIIPALWVLHLLGCYGGAAYGNALTMNVDQGHDIPHHLHLSSYDICLSTALNYVAYIIFGLPMNLCSTMVAPKVWLNRIIIMIGFAYACIAVVNSTAGLKVIRFCTGVAAAGIWPGLSYYVSNFYPADRLSARIGHYFTATQISGTTAGLFAACFQLIDGTYGFTGYQWMFVIYGVITVIAGLALCFWLPNRPRGQAIWPLTTEELKLHQDHLKFCGVSHGRWTWKDFAKVLRDPRVWPLVFMYIGIVGCSSAIGNYTTTILHNSNPSMSPVTLSLLNAPIWLFDLAGALLVPPIADKFKSYRGLIFSLSTSILICGMFVCTFAPTLWSRWGGLLISGTGLGALIPITMAWGVDIFRKRHGDLGVAMATALIFGLGNLGSVATSYLMYHGWPEDTERGHHDSNMVVIALLGVSIIAASSNTVLQYALGDFGDKSLVDMTFLSRFRRARPQQK